MKLGLGKSRLVELEKFKAIKRGSINPAIFPEEEFEYYSIPAYDTGQPSLTLGSEIGSSKKIIKKNDVLLSRIVPHIRRAWVVESKSNSKKIGSGEWIIFNSDKINSDYLRSFFSSDKFNVQFLQNLTGVGGSLMRANPKLTGKIKIPLPPLDKQKEIAHLLDTADTLRQKTQEQLVQLDELAQSIFLDMFGDPVLNEKGWDMIRMDKLTRISSGSTPSRSNLNYYNGDIPWVKTGELNGELINTTEEHLTELGIRESSCKIYPKNSILVAMYGQGKTRGKVGLTNVQVTTNQACAVIEPNSDYNTSYLFEYFKNSYEQLRQLGRGGNQPNLNTGMIKAYKVMMPELPLQNQFAAQIQNIQSQKEKLKKSLKESEDLFNCLMQDVFG